MKSENTQKSKVYDFTFDNNNSTNELLKKFELLAIFEDHLCQYFQIFFFKFDTHLKQKKIYSLVILFQKFKQLGSLNLALKNL